MSARNAIWTVPILLAALASQALAQGYTVEGTSAEELGTSVDGVGDVNGDGHPDFLVGSPGWAGNGRAQLYSGADGTRLWELMDVTGQRFGSTVSAAGDVNNNGFDDFLITDENAAWVELFDWQNGMIGFFPGSFSDAHGHALSELGDLNGDGFDDFAIGAHGKNNSTGEVKVYSGNGFGTLHLLQGTQIEETFGFSVASAGDVDGDGVPDVIVGSPRFDPVDLGKATVFSGDDGSVIWTLIGGARSDHFGWSVSGVGDMDQDGRDDFVVGAPRVEALDGTLDVGAVYVYSGATAALLHTRYGTQSGELFGYSVSGTGDTNGNGVPDFLVGAPYWDQFGMDSGKIYQYSGSGALLLTALGTFLNGRFGYSVAGTGDLNGDTFHDFVVGIPGDQFGGGPDYGRAWVPFSCPALWSNYGSGWAGTLGVPALTLNAVPQYGGMRTLTVGNSSGASTVGLFYMGLSSANIPTAKGGTLLVLPALSFLLPIPPAGLSLGFMVPPYAQTCDPPLYLQVLQADAGASHGISFTPGLMMKFGLIHDG